MGTGKLSEKNSFQLEAKTEDLVASDSDEDPDEQAILEAAYQQMNSVGPSTGLSNGQPNTGTPHLKSTTPEGQVSGQQTPV